MTPLRQRMSEDVQVRNLAPHTQRSYLQQISQFARHFGKQFARHFGKSPEGVSKTWGATPRAGLLGGQTVRPAPPP